MRWCPLLDKPQASPEAGHPTSSIDADKRVEHGQNFDLKRESY